MGGRTITCGEAFSRDNKGGCVWSEVEEELDENVEGKHSMARQVFVGESPNDEENSEDDESHQLDRLATNGIHGSDTHPVTRNGAGADENAVTGSQVVKDLVNSGPSTVANCSKYSGGVKTETVESNIEEEPRTCCSEQDLSVLPLTVKSEEVGPTGLGDLKSLRLRLDLGGAEIAFNSTGLAIDISFDVVLGLFNIPSYIECISGSLRNGETVVKGKNGRHSTEA
jgi:hypothetical protein